MTEEQIKEHLSRSFVRLVANRAGYKCKMDEDDHGTDITLAEVRPRRRGSSNRVAETGRYVDLQLKCTCEASTIPIAGAFKFDLEAKTFNDLVERLADPDAAPLVLVVFVLPDDNASWLSVSITEMILRRTAYWWQPASGTTVSSNERTVRITIPSANAVGLDFVSQLYRQFYS